MEDNNNTNEKQHTREDDDDGEDDSGVVCDWYTRQKNQPSLTSQMPLQPTEDTRYLADDTLVDGNRWNQPMESPQRNRTTKADDMDDDHNLT
jgi:hypothetical protein